MREVMDRLNHNLLHLFHGSFEGENLCSLLDYLLPAWLPKFKLNSPMHAAHASRLFWICSLRFFAHSSALRLSSFTSKTLLVARAPTGSGGTYFSEALGFGCASLTGATSEPYATRLLIFCNSAMARV